MSKCKECGTDMRPLFNGEFCPNDCDRPEVLAKRNAEKAKIAAKNLAESKLSQADIEKFWKDHWGYIVPGAGVNCQHEMYKDPLKVNTFACKKCDKSVAIPRTTQLLGITFILDELTKAVAEPAPKINFATIKKMKKFNDEIDKLQDVMAKPRIWVEPVSFLP